MDQPLITLDNLAHGMLFFSEPTMVLVIITVGFLFIHRRLFFQAFCLTALSMILNVSLKRSIQLLLSATPTGEYGFRSGHTQSSTVFYLFLAWYIPCVPFRIAIVMVLTGIGGS